MLRRIWRWVAEVAGVGILAIAAWMIYPPLGVVVIGVYVLIVANTEEAEGEE